MRKALTALVLAAAVATSGCAACSGAARRPDEFAVARNAPLIIPPDFSLAPPVAGTAGLTPGEAQQQAIDALFGGPAPRSARRDQPARRRRPRRRADRHPLDRCGIPTRASSTRARRRCRSCRRQPANSNVASAQPGQ